MDFTIVAAHFKGIIGVEKEGKLRLPWKRIPSDMKYFKDQTQNSIVIVGRKTYETLPPLPGRVVLVITSSFMPGVVCFSNFEQSLEYAALLTKPIFVIGGGQLYKTAIQSKWCKALDITEISEGPISGDPIAYFPPITKNFVIENSVPKSSDFEKEYQPFKDGDYILKHRIYKNLYDGRSSENTYLSALNTILSEGCQKEDRTGVGTLSTFGQVLKFEFGFITDGYYSFPLLTTKKMFLRGIIEELLFFLRGGVDNDLLKDKNVHIWDGNTTREFLDQRGMSSFEDGSLGKAYGFQWRFWGAKWEGKKANYKGKGHDQISTIINQLKTDPFSRRIVLSAWNVSDLAEMCLPPCHTMYVFNVQIVDGKKKLFCHLTQRSGDMFLGVPFNIASASLLTFIIAKCTGLEPGGLTLSIVDAHIYLNHIEQCKLQISRLPYHFPSLKITKDINSIEDIENLCYGDFSLQNYNCHPGIKADMAI
jgi:dihydrofolate reductase / thymidylate synthase